MGLEVIWLPKAVETFSENVLYLQENWTQREVQKFVLRVNEVLSVLPEHPHLFRSSQRFRTLHLAPIVKQVSLVYKVKEKEGKIELITFVNNYRKPKY